MISNRISSLDALRGIAALAVVLYHYTFRYNAIYGHKFSLDYLSALKYGHLGVQLFFMISGFVIYLSLENTTNIRKFALNRFSRLYPTYWFAVALTFFAVMIFGLPGRDVTFIDMIINLSMFQGFIGVTNVDGVYWTLKVELTFYLIIALFYFIFPRRHIFIYFLTLLAIAFLIKYFYLLDSTNHILKVVIYMLSVDYLHFFGAGIGFYLLSKKDSYLLALLLIIASLFYNLFFVSGIELIITIAFYIIFLLLVYGKTNFLSKPVLIYFGTISYPLYLIHQNIGYIILNYTYHYDINIVFGFLLAFSVSILIAHFISKYIDQIVGKKLKKRLSRYVY